MPDPTPIPQGNGAPVGAPPGELATPERLAEILGRGTLAQQQLTAYPNQRRQATPTPMPPPPASNINPVTGVPVALPPQSPLNPPLPVSIPGISPQGWAALPPMRQWLTPRPAGLNFPNPIGPGLPPSSFSPPGSVEQNILGVSMPQGAMRMVLRQRGINPDTTLGQFYLSQADELKTVFEISSQQGGALQPGQTTPTADGYLSFLHGYLDRMQDQGSGGRQDITALRGVVMAQVHEALNSPLSPIYQSLADQMELRKQQPGQEGPPEMVLWFGLIRPALMATGATPAHLRGAQGNFMKHYRDYQETVVTAGAGNLTFQQYLVAAGYDPFR